MRKLLYALFIFVVVANTLGNENGIKNEKTESKALRPQERGVWFAIPALAALIVEALIGVVIVVAAVAVIDYVAHKDPNYRHPYILGNAGVIHDIQNAVVGKGDAIIEPKIVEDEKQQDQISEQKNKLPQDEKQKKEEKDIKDKNKDILSTRVKMDQFEPGDDSKRKKRRECPCEQSFQVSESRIIGGSNVFSILTRPWQVYLVIEIGTTTQTCGGSFIGCKVEKDLLTDKETFYSTHILTAMHCLTKEDPNTKQIIDHAKPEGVKIFYGNVDHTNGYTAKVGSIIKKPDYNSTTGENDIAILTLERPIEMQPFARSICYKIPHGVHLTNKNAIASGWGVTIRESLLPEFAKTKILKQIDVKILSNDECNKQLNENNARTLTNVQMCAGKSRDLFDLDYKDGTGSGDSGGPLDSSINDKRYLVGVTSSGYKLREYHPYKITFDIFTRVSEYVPWIDLYVG